VISREKRVEGSREQPWDGIVANHDRVCQRPGCCWDDQPTRICEQEDVRGCESRHRYVLEASPTYVGFGRATLVNLGT
jgi:hypothetical protein